MLIDALFLTLIAPAIAFADPNIQLDMEVSKQVIVEENGQEVTRWVDASDVEPGQKLRYTVRYINVGDEPATDVRIENPVPELTVYLSDSASGQGSSIVFSADGGETYEPPEQVTYEVTVFGGGTDRRKANADRFTNIRWQIEEIAPGSTGEVSFVVMVQ
jgi:uncharacterized repeat protein (TIGR01451 family)